MHTFRHSGSLFFTNLGIPAALLFYQAGGDIAVSLSVCMRSPSVFYAVRAVPGFLPRRTPHEERTKKGESPRKVIPLYQSVRP